jgi:hypothetical protein
LFSPGIPVSAINKFTKLQDELSGLELREKKSERRISDLLNVITNMKLDKQKSLVQDLYVDISNTSEESNGENNNMSPDHEKKSKGMCNYIYVIE